MRVSLFKKGDLVYITTTNSIGFIINQGEDPNGEPWFRTDVDGIRESQELAKITKPGGILNLIMNNGEIFIPNSIKKSINKHFSTELFDENLLAHV